MLSIINKIRTICIKKQITENRQKWLAVLRDPESRKHVKSLEKFTDPNSRCCLGHACHALDIEKNKGSEFGFIYYDGEAGILPKQAQKKLRVDAVGNFKKPIRINGIDSECLVELNDCRGLTPKEMADVIEDQFENHNFCYP